MHTEILNDEATLAMAFAQAAANRGWSRTTLNSFCAERGLDSDRLWPQGVRAVARALNDAADQQMLMVWQGARSRSLAEVIRRRFRDNEPLRASVAALARNDALHPVDTLLRTGSTAGHMLTCLGRRGAGKWRLVLAYSAAVLVWIGDRSPEQKRTEKATQLFLALVGLT